MKKIIVLCFFVSVLVAGSAFAQAPKVVVIPLGGKACGKGVLNGEEVDPPISQFSTLNVSSDTCRYDFSNVPQLYCNGGCSWGGASSCDQVDADIFCQLKTGNPNSTASVFTTGVATAEPGFNCAFSGGAIITADVTGRLNPSLLPLGFSPRYADTSLLSHSQ